jgi:putative transposase
LVDTLGLIWGLAVLPAAPTDWDGAVEVFGRVGKSLPRLAKVWADSAYGVDALFAWIKGHCRWVLDVVKKRPGQTTFEVRKWRWIVERTFGWFNRYRRLSKDYEQNPKSSETWIYIAMIHRMSRFTDSSISKATVTLPRGRRPLLGMHSTSPVETSGR